MKTFVVEKREYHVLFFNNLKLSRSYNSVKGELNAFLVFIG
jgi:hypothetical protein